MPIDRANFARCAGRPRRGFTLVELLVAVALGSMILLVIAQVFSGASQVFTTSTQTQEAYSNVRIVFDIMEDQVESLCPEWNPSLSPQGNIKGVVGEANGAVTTTAFRFYQTDDDPGVVTYRFKNSTEELEWAYKVDDWTAPGDGDYRAIVKDVKMFQARYLNTHNASASAVWENVWNASAHPYLPAAIAVTITVSGVQTGSGQSAEDLTFSHVFYTPIASPQQAP